MRKGLWLAGIAVLAGVALAHAAPDISGFVEGTQTMRVQKNAALGGGGFKDWAYPRSDFRAQLKLSGGGDRDEYFLRMDFLSDQTHTVGTQLDIREAYVKVFPYKWLDVKAGRQVATWGTGDLLFANDLFAKDWVAFFTGQELSYLKLPQDLIRFGLYTGGPTIEFAASPYYTMDNLPDGGRLSVYNPFLGQSVGSAQAATIAERAKSIDNAEVFARLSGAEGGYEWALYAYRGFFPQPIAVTFVDTTPALFAPRLSAAGASLRSSAFGYLWNIEGAYYNSEQDRDGTDLLLPNSAVKLLAGVEKSLGGELTAGAQWFGDWMMNYDDYERPFIAAGAEPMADELRHTVTLRLTKFLRYQTVMLSFFGYWGISDEDVYLRPSVDYNFTDAVKLTVGGNWLDGRHPYTMFGQFRNNSNVYARVRYSF